jgi:translation initiation factor IF-3
MKILKTSSFEQKKAIQMEDANVMTPENEDMFLSRMLNNRVKVTLNGREKFRRDMGKKVLICLKIGTNFLNL